MILCCCGRVFNTEEECDEHYLEEAELEKQDKIANFLLIMIVLVMLYIEFMTRNKINL